MKAVLVVNSGVHAGREIPIGSTQFLVGRASHCDLRPKSPQVSRMHCVFYVDAMAIRLHEIDGAGRTRVNGKSLDGPTLLSSGDRVEIGPLDFTLVVMEDAAFSDAPSTSSTILIGRDAKPHAAETDIHSSNGPNEHWFADILSSSSSNLKRTVQKASESAKRLVHKLTDAKRPPPARTSRRRAESVSVHDD